MTKKRSSAAVASTPLTLDVEKTFGDKKYRLLTPTAFVGKKTGAFWLTFGGWVASDADEGCVTPDVVACSFPGCTYFWLNKKKAADLLGQVGTLKAHAETHYKGTPLADALKAKETCSSLRTTRRRARARKRSFECLTCVGVPEARHRRSGVDHRAGE